MPQILIVVHLVEIGAVGWPQIWWNEVWHFDFKFQLSGVRQFREPYDVTIFKKYLKVN